MPSEVLLNVNLSLSTSGAVFLYTDYLVEAMSKCPPAKWQIQMVAAIKGHDSSWRQHCRQLQIPKYETQTSTQICYPLRCFVTEHQDLHQAHHPHVVR